MNEPLLFNFLPYIFGTLAALLGIVWNNLNEKIKSLQENERGCPIHTVKDDIATLKNDVKWLKDFLMQQTK